MTSALEVRELDVPFGEQPGLSGISFAVAPGERFALVGASGVGKTSLLRALAGTGALTGGQVLVEGRDVTSLPPEHRDTVLLAQRPLLFPHLSVQENVAFPLKVRRVDRTEVAQRVAEVLKAVHMEDFGARRPHSLSGGQAHRVALARAVVARPPVLLLDEPLTSLDPALREEVRRSILAVQAEYGPALVWVTHDLGEAGRMADRVGVVLDGALAQVDTPEALFRHPATVSVARFMGLPNELSGHETPDGTLELAGWPVPEPDQKPEPESRMVQGALGQGGPVSAVFGVDGLRLVPVDSGGVPARIVNVLHRPSGATASLTFSPRSGHVPDSAGTAGAAGTPDSTGAPDSPTTPISCEVSVDPHHPPSPGTDVEFFFRRENLHIFPA
jgi:ABC-type Fe3+/spermidine/putrescine transport system ATPase subunit